MVEASACCVLSLYGFKGIDCLFFFFQAEDGIRDLYVTGVQTCALPISLERAGADPSLVTLQRVAEPAAAAPAVGAHVQVVTDSNDPDRRGRAQRSVRSQRCDVDFGGRADGVELVGGPVPHRADSASTTAGSVTAA